MLPTQVFQITLEGTQGEGFRLDHPQELWSFVKDSLNQKNPANPVFHSYFGPTELIGVEEHVNGRNFKLGVPSDLHKYWITQNLLPILSSEFAAVYHAPFQIELVVTENEKSEASSGKTEWSYEGEDHAATSLMNMQSRSPERRDVMNPEYRFNTFVVGRTNEFAHNASVSIAENPGQGYNPLFIYGPTGLGKTHLLHAVGNHIREKFPHYRICYMSAEKFLNECISSIRRKEMEKFRAKYRDNYDVLLVDDIQIFGKGESTQEEFFYTFNEFFEKGKQVVMASDRMPRDIQGLADRVRTRLEWGLIADIQMPDLETRVAILKFKAELKRLWLPNEVANYIARISKRSIRELEGNLNKVKMFSELQGVTISLELAKRVLSIHEDTTTVSIEELQKMTADHFKIRLTDLKSNSRTKPIIRARQVAMFLMKKHLDKSLVDIGRAFGGKDHTTVINALRRIEDQLLKDTDLKRDIDELENRIHNITGV